MEDLFWGVRGDAPAARSPQSVDTSLLRAHSENMEAAKKLSYDSKTYGLDFRSHYPV
jgi:hypothetical protein